MTTFSTVTVKELLDLHLLLPDSHSTPTHRWPSHLGETLPVCVCVWRHRGGSVLVIQSCPFRCRWPGASYTTDCPPSSPVCPEWTTPVSLQPNLTLFSICVYWHQSLTYYTLSSWPLQTWLFTQLFLSPRPFPDSTSHPLPGSGRQQRGVRHRSWSSATSDGKEKLI